MLLNIWRYCTLESVIKIKKDVSTHFSEPVRPVLSSMLADMVGYHFITIFVITYESKEDFVSDN